MQIYWLSMATIPATQTAGQCIVKGSMTTCPIVYEILKFLMNNDFKFWIKLDNFFVLIMAMVASLESRGHFKWLTWLPWLSFKILFVPVFTLLFSRFSIISPNYSLHTNHYINCCTHSLLLLLRCYAFYPFLNGNYSVISQSKRVLPTIFK